MHQLIQNNKHLLSSLLVLILFAFGCDKNSDSVIDSTGEAPFLSNANYSLSVIWTDTIFVEPVQTPDDLLTIRGVATVKIIHPEGINGIKRVACSVFRNDNSPANGYGILNDDGISPDIAANDSIFSGYVDFQIYRVDLGTYWISFSGESISGYSSNIQLLPIQIARTNRPPVISNLSAPDTLHFDEVFRININASDPDGLADIYSVGYFSLKPDSTYANSGNIIGMYDDGIPVALHGDAVANDGIYSYLAYVPNPSLVGMYKWSFVATDRSGASSDTITHSVVLVP